MEITYLGSASHHISGEQNVFVNPPDKPAATDIALFGSPQKGRSRIVNGPGEYEIRDVLILTVAAGPTSTSLAHAIEIEGVSIVHMDPPVARLSAEALDAIGRVDVLVVRADNLEAAQGAIRDLEPRVVLPFGPKAAELCSALGVQSTPESRFVWKANGKLPKAVLLRARPPKRRAA